MAVASIEPRAGGKLIAVVCVALLACTNGKLCDDSHPCRAGDACLAGVCASGEPLTVCVQYQTCAGSRSGFCSVPCSSFNDCPSSWQPAVCSSGVCSPSSCSDEDRLPNRCQVNGDCNHASAQ
jgi:hypothetical protein